MEAAAPALPSCVLAKRDGCEDAGMATVALRALAAAMPCTKTRGMLGSAPGHGEWMYSGGAFGSDGRLYLIPRNASRVARLEPVSGKWECIGDSFPEGGDKWVDAVVSGVDGCIYALPCECNVPHILKIDPKAGTARTVGESVLRHSQGVKAYAWHSMVLAGDGCMYGIPHTASCILKFDPRTQELSSFGALGFDATGSQYFNGVLGPEGRYFYCPPANAGRVLRVDTHTSSCDLIGQDFGKDVKWKWYGGGMGGDGAIYCVPLGHDRVLRIEPSTQTASLFGPPLGGVQVSWRGGTAGADGCVYGAPYFAEKVLRIDPFAGTVSTDGSPIPSELQQKFLGMALDQKGSLWCLPLHLPCGVLEVIPPSMSAPVAPLRALITDPRAFQRCLYTQSLREVFVPMMHHHAHLYKRCASQPAEQEVSVAAHLQEHRPQILAALNTVGKLPLPTAMARGDDFVSLFAASSAVRLAPAPNAWQPLPASVDGWSWPPPPLVPLRAACTLARDGGPDAVEAAWPTLSQAMSELLLRMVEAVQAELPRATKMLTTVFDRERERSLGTYR